MRWPRWDTLVTHTWVLHNGPGTLSLQGQQWSVLVALGNSSFRVEIRILETSTQADSFLTARW